MSLAGLLAAVADDSQLRTALASSDTPDAVRDIVAPSALRPLVVAALAAGTADGGGVVPASAILVGGDPGVGKSTLLLQVCASAALRGLACAYVSGEEAIEQVRARAQRMGFGHPWDIAQAPIVPSYDSIEDLLQPALRGGQRAGAIDDLDTARARCQADLAALSLRSKRFLNPQPYVVGLDDHVHARKVELIENTRAHQ